MGTNNRKSVSIHPSKEEVWSIYARVFGNYVIQEVCNWLFDPFYCYSLNTPIYLVKGHVVIVSRERRREPCSFRLVVVVVDLFLILILYCRGGGGV